VAEDISANLARQVRDAANHGDELRIAGNRSKPWTADDSPNLNRASLNLAPHNGVVEYQPSELVITVRAGTPLSELDAVLAEHGQILGAECPDFGGNSTIGGALALGWSGPRALAGGAMRDAVLGIRIINGMGEVLQFGGQVMKNVAGFDVSRLMCGSLGQLAVILDISLKVLPQSESELYLRSEQPSLAAARQLLRDLLQVGEPVTGAVYCDNILDLRFSGREATLQRLQQSVQGSPVEAAFWHELQQQRLPFFSTPASAPLTDCHGPVSWCYREGELWREHSDGAVKLSLGPQRQQSDAVRSALLTRLCDAFDPKGVFGGGREN
jgi:glycolate oxidase FAD binding subunit